MDINYIKDYIIKNYSNSCLATKINRGNTFDEDELITECEDFFYYEKLH